MSDTTKPDYLGLLNRISLAERNAGIYLKAWADVTPDAGFRRALALVAARETTHAEVFRQRIERLGFSLIEHDDPEAVERTRVYGDAARCDAEKVAAARRRAAQFDAEEFFRSIDQRVADESVDSLTRDTLRWFVGEERDSRALLSAEYERIEAMAGVEAEVAAGARGRTRAAPSSINRPWVVRSARPRVLTTPADTVDWNPRGLPIAITSGPTLSVAETPSRAAGNPGAVRRITARSGWDPRRPGGRSERPTVGQCGVQARRVVDDMAVGQHVAVGRDDHCPSPPPFGRRGSRQTGRHSSRRRWEVSR